MARVTLTETTDGLPALSTSERARYGRHLVLPQIGTDGQRRLKAARVLLIGAGGLGSPVALYLAAAGVGTLGLVDFDVVDVTNLHRQLLHGTADIGRPKVESARERLHDVNPHVTLHTHHEVLSTANALDIVGAYDLVVDGTDNFATRYLANDACVLLRKPYVYGSIHRFDGQASLFAHGDAPCYRCLYPVPPPAGMVPSCAEGGVFGVLPGLIGTIMATEVIKWITGIGTTLAGRLLLLDALTMQFHQVQVARDPACPLCGTREIQTLVDYDTFCGSPAITMPSAMTQPDLLVTDLAAWLSSGRRISLIDVREQDEWDTGHIAGATHIPLGQLQGALDQLVGDPDVVVMCRSGVRSARAVAALHGAGVPSARNLAGGILAWASEVDPAMPT
jgi:sulfur-carrier protein adenylyltransferase/sulfurtransferase